MQKVQIATKFEPRDYQKPLLKAMLGEYKRAVCIWARRLGKDITAWNFMIYKALTEPRTYYYFFPTYAQGKKILWDGMDFKGKPFLSYIPPEVIVDKHETDMKITLSTGSVIQVVGVNNIDSVVGTNPYGLVYSEYALMDEDGWNFMRPVIRENGGWAIFIYTPRGNNHGHKLWKMASRAPGWFTQLLTIEDARREDGSPIVSQADIEEELREGMNPDLVQQEYFCSFEGPHKGAYYAKQVEHARREGRITQVPHDPGSLVHTAWDIGVGDSAIWFYQIVGLQIRVIDYVEDKGLGLPDYVSILQEKPYVYGRYFAPHDINVADWGTGVTRIETGLDLGINFEMVPKLAIEDGINAVRRIFPRLVFDEEKCSKGLDALSSYCREYNKDKKEFRSTPCKDWASHGADAMRYLALGVSMEADPIIQTRAETLFDIRQMPPYQGFGLGQQIADTEFTH
jgi:hypothetical protein